MAINIFVHRAILLFLTSVLLLFVFLSDNLNLLILCLLTNTLLINFVGYIEHKDWKTPLLVFPAILFLYSVIFPLYFSLGGTRVLNVSVIHVIEALKLCFYFSYGLVIGYISSPLLSPTKIRGLINRTQYKLYWVGNIEVKFTLVLFLILYSYSYVQLMTAWHLTKEQRMITGVISFTVFYGGIYLCFAYLLINNYIINRNLDKRLIFFILFVGLTGFYFFGERDQFVIPFIVVVFIYGYFNKVSLKKIIILGLATISILFILGVIRGFIESGQQRQLTGLVDFLQENEFISTNRNISLIISSKQDFIYGQTYLGDFLYSLFIPLEKTGVIWFTDNFIENKGFSIVGEAYINFGVLGVFFMGVFMMSMLLFLYRQSFKTNINTIIYILLLIASLYSIRSDFAAISSAFIKKIIIPSGLIMFIRSFRGNIKIKKAVL
jgi:oligosaccharide repeat unit polymerase